MFEAAQVIKEKLILLEKYQAKSAVVSPSVGDVDVFTILEDAKMAYVNFMKVMHGCVVQSVTVEVNKKLEESRVEILMMAVAEFRERKLSEADELVLPMDPEIEIPNVTITLAQRGDKSKLLELSLRNAFYYKAEREKQKELIDPERHVNRIMERMMEDLRLSELPYHIECFDNSNTQGSDAVSAMVLFRKGKPSKKEYRHFNIRTVEGPDDYASMEEVISRRYKRLLDEGQPLPHLIIVDGGKGQLSAAVESLCKLGVYGKVGIIGIAKRLEEIYYPNDPLPLYLDKKSETLRVIQHMRDEAHRFGITHHRKKREKRSLRTELVDIKGVGEAITQRLLTHFKSVKNIEQATLDELGAIIGKNKARVVFAHFHPNDA
jgi:excinuclease ABC subunit C